jgi:hypothetical protein
MRRGRPASIRASGILIAIVAAVCSPAPSVAAGAATVAKPSESFVESIGVNVHTSYTDTPYYAQFETVKERLNELGIRHIRDGLVLGASAQRKKLNELAQAGVKSTLILGDPRNGLSGLDELVSDVETELPDAVDAVEGPNEWSTSGDSEWELHLIAYQERLYQDIKASASLSQLPVIGPSIVHGDQQELGDVSAFLDYGNIHSYPEGNPPEYRMGLNVERAKYNSGSKPIMATETGYTNALNWTPTGPGENKPISEEGAAVYMPRLFFEYFIRHIARTFSYELVDQRPDPELNDREEHFGLLRNDLSRKPAFMALRNTIEILEDPGPAFSPGALAFSLDDEGTAILHHTLLEKRDGTFYLALWRLESVWDPDKKEALGAPSEPVTVHLESGAKSYSVYAPTLSSAPVSTVSQPTESMTVDVGSEVVILELTPEPPPMPEPPPTTEPPILSLAIAPLVTEDAPRQTRCVVPNLIGKRLKGAKRRLRKADCGIGSVVRRNGAGARTGKVVKQRPQPGKVLRAGTGVAMTLGS